MFLPISIIVDSCIYLLGQAHEHNITVNKIIRVVYIVYDSLADIADIFLNIFRLGESSHARERMPPKKGKRNNAAVVPKDAAPAAKRSRSKPYRTPQNPVEIAAAAARAQAAKEAGANKEDDDLYKVESIKGIRFVKGARQYRVRWEGYAEKDDTWEPMEHLVGCAEHIRKYENNREVEYQHAKQAVVDKREKAKEAAAAEREKLKEAAAAAKTSGEVAGEGGDQEQGGDTEASTSTGGILRQHKGKKGAVWSAFDLTVEKPTCKLKKAGFDNQICGDCPTSIAGTTNYWAHLWVHHRADWYALKKQEGAL